MAKVTINGKEHNMRFSLGFWEKVKSVADITQANIQDKLNDDFGKNAAEIVHYGIMYGIPSSERNAALIPTLEDIKENLDQSVIDAIEETFIEGLSKAQKAMVESIKTYHKEKIDELVKKKA